jgi:hypothetical protein
MNDQDVIANINQLTNEEHELLEKGGGEGGLNEVEQARLQSLEVCLDQLWDLLRQRRARGQNRLDPDEAKLRDPDTVEKYLQ